MTYVYHARFISEDTNPWDANESYGVWRHLEDAKDKAFASFTAFDGKAISWVPTEKTWSGLGEMETWVRVEHSPGEEPEDPEEGYGMFIFKEKLL